jgi:hypothetical protein
VSEPRNSGKVAIVALVILAIYTGYFVAKRTDDGPPARAGAIPTESASATPAGSATSASPVDSTEDCVDVDLAVTLSEGVTADLEAGLVALENLDVSGAAGHLRAVAATYGQIAEIWEPDPQVARLLQEASDEMYLAADEMDAGNIELAATYMDLATSKVEEATALLPGTDAAIC